jgi:excisionase family DNA binding protein
MSRDEKLLTVKEVAERWRVTERTVRTWIDKGAVHALKKGGTVRIVDDRATGTTTSAA